MSEVVVVAIATAADGRADEAEALIRGVIPATHAEAGCLTYALHRDVSDPHRLVLIERWSSREALDQHLASDHLTAFRAAVRDLAAAPSQVFILEALPDGDPVKGMLGGGEGHHAAAAIGADCVDPADRRGTDHAAW